MHRSSPLKSDLATQNAKTQAKKQAEQAWLTPHQEITLNQSLTNMVCAPLLTGTTVFMTFAMMACDEMISNTNAFNASHSNTTLTTPASHGFIHSLDQLFGAPTTSMLKLLPIAFIAIQGSYGLFKVGMLLKHFYDENQKSKKLLTADNIEKVANDLKPLLRAGLFLGLVTGCWPLVIACCALVVLCHLAVAIKTGIEHYKNKEYGQMAICVFTELFKAALVIVSVVMFMELNKLQHDSACVEHDKTALDSASKSDMPSTLSTLQGDMATMNHDYTVMNNLISYVIAPFYAISTIGTVIGSLIWLKNWKQKRDAAKSEAAVCSSSGSSVYGSHKRSSPGETDRSLSSSTAPGG